MEEPGPRGGLERATARPSSRDGAVCRPRAPSRGHRWDCSPRREAAAALKPRRPGDRGPRVAAALALASLDSTAVPVGLPTSALPSPQPRNPARAEVRLTVRVPPL